MCFISLTALDCVCVCVCVGAREATGPEEGSGPTEPAGGVQDCPLSATVAEAATSDWGESLTVTMTTLTVV